MFNTPTYINSATTTDIATGNIQVHTIICPIALTGTATFRDRAGSPATYFILPIGSIGCFILDDNFPNGLSVVTSAADKLIISSKQ